MVRALLFRVLDAVEADGFPEELRHLCIRYTYAANSRTGEAWFGQEHMARVLGISERQLRRRLALLDQLAAEDKAPVRILRRRSGAPGGVGRSSDRWRIVVVTENPKRTSASGSDTGDGATRSGRACPVEVSDGARPEEDIHDTRTGHPRSAEEDTHVLGSSGVIQRSDPAESIVECSGPKGRTESREDEGPDPWGLAPPKPAEDTQGKAVKRPRRGQRAAAPEPKADEASQIRTVFEHWQKARSHPSAKLDPTRRGKIKARLREGFTVEQLCRAIDGVARSDWHCGDNPSGKVYDDLVTVLRDAPQVEKFLALAPRTNPGPRPEPPPPRREPPLAKPIGEIPGLRGPGGPLAALRPAPEAPTPIRSRSEQLAGLAALQAESDAEADAVGGAS